jgi:primosomal protein N' (replication factor Y)
LKILRIALPVPLRKIFDYLPAGTTELATLEPGMRVQVPFQRRQLVGVLVGLETQTPIDPKKLKMIDAVLDTASLLPPELLKFCQWAADYYHYPLGEVLQAAFPGLLRKGKNLPLPVAGKAVTGIYLPQAPLRQPLSLNEPQAAIVQALAASLDNFSVVTVDGVTGSGKTEVYLHIIQQVLAKNKQALALVPEISLTPQTIARFRERFAVPIVALHSGLSEKARLNAWLAARSGEARIVIGTRSAIFTPLAQLGLIIVDEEHDPSFKQQDSFRYNARDLAIWRARDTNIPIVLGSATPSLETLRRSWEGPYRYFALPERAGGARLPTFQVVDVRRQFLEEGLSAVLLQEVKTHLQAGNQVLLFLNRRGFSPVLICRACGWMAECRHCDARLTYHLRPERLHCHYCEAQMAVPQRCGSCGDQQLNALGLGTEKLEIALQKHFPEFPLARLDRDSTRRKGKMEEVLTGIQNGVYRILIGTQMVAKGHHVPNVTLVGIIDSDYGLFSSDFRASERLGQLILQVAGRAGRAAKPGAVWIQTHHPDHPLIQLLQQGNYQAFAKSLLTERRSAALPPFSSLALFHAEAHRSSEVEDFLKQVKALAASVDASVSIRGPVAAIMARRAGRHRMQLLLQAKQKKSLQLFLRKLLVKVDNLPSKLRIHWTVDVDPLEMG